ncbi:uncharacterized protein CDV56_109124 [Aspergillus thermomutatus]|uniref:Fungal N-terminal domain-containing protein n=1 Tax=Aspergillus thermomutatus TaxID=41047 RepID=A0A397HS14_ASPTH|nr:uncharacterized protein CDV56_109124 [Aspergillus thermomutatus]RHZ65985.1 hypothetical protein CDV56_109124 [Aspergillus thermomutatus]
MSEPLSVVASAAGIISLGIQVIEKIIVYCDSWKGYDKDLGDLSHKASGLSKTLELLENVLQHRQIVDSLSQKQIEDLMDASKVTIDKLKEMTDKIPCHSSSSKAAFTRRALYPLRKQTLVDAAGMLDSLQANINTALSVLLLHQGSVAQNNLSQELHTQHSTLQNKLSEQNAQLERMSQVMEKKIELQSRLLRFSLTLTLSITKGAGGCSIAPTLTYRGITTQDFESLIGEYFRDTPVLERNYVQCCHYLFEKRIIRPSDTQTNEATLLEVVFALIVLRRYGPEEFYNSFQKVTRYLIEAGVPVNTSQNTLLDLLLHGLRADHLSHPVMSELIDAGSYITDKALTHYNRKEIQSFLSHHPEAVYVSSPALALVHEDEETFARIVRRDKLSGNDTIGKYKAIELAIGWPSGVKTLLEAGMDSVPPHALMFAVDLGCTSSLKLLLEAGDVLTTESIGYIGIKAKNGEMDLLIDGIILRRTELRDLAITCLSEHKWREIGVSRDSLPDLIAPKVYESLRAEGVDVPKRLRPSWYREYTQKPDGEIQVEMPYFCVFHLINLLVRYMQRLYDAGLTDVDEPDSAGLTPLMCTRGATSPSQLFSRARWLVSKGANPSRLLPGTATPTMHKIISASIVLIQDLTLVSWKAVISEYVDTQFAYLDRGNRTFLKDAITENKHDGCSEIPL